MKINMSAGGTAKWFAVTVASSDKGTGPGSKFDQLVSNPDWNPDNIDFKIVLNGIEFDNLDDIFRRLDEHTEEVAAEKAEQNPLWVAKMEAIKTIMNAECIEEITGEWT